MRSAKSRRVLVSSVIGVVAVIVAVRRPFGARRAISPKPQPLEDRGFKPLAARKKARMEIGIVGLLVVILLVILIIYFIRRA